MEVSEDVKLRVVSERLTTMFRTKQFFDWCTVRDSMELLGIHASGDVKRILEMYHCVHYSDMDRETAEMIYTMTTSLFEGDGILKFPPIQIQRSKEKVINIRTLIDADCTDLAIPKKKWWWQK